MILTATEIDNNKKSINKQLEEEVLKKIKSLLSSKVREFKKRKHSEDENYVFTKEDKEVLKQQVIESKELTEFKERMYDFLLSRNENYYILRDTLQDLNELNEFSAEIERTGFQTIDNFKSFGELIKQNITYNERFVKYRQIREEELNKYIASYKNKKLPFNDDIQSLLKKMYEIYDVTKDMDDIDVFDKFGMESNIDISNKIGDICFYELANDNNLYDNFVNNWFQKDDVISKLSKRNIISTKMLGMLLTSSKVFVSNNYTTCYRTMYDTTDNVKSTYTTRTLGELFLQIIDPKLEYLNKQDRQQIYMTYDGTRGKNESFYKWNGLQVFDVDLKEWDQLNLIEILKRKLYDYLRDFHWFLWIAKSASGKGIHIYTKVTPPHHVYTDIRDNEYISKYWYYVNYTHKVSIIYDIFKHINDDLSNTIRFNNSDFKDNFELRFVDAAVSRISSGIRLTYDNNILVNPGFIDLHPAIGLSQTIEGNNNYEYTMKLFFRETEINKKMLSTINELCIQDSKEIKLHKDVEDIDLTKYDFAGDFNGITVIPRNQINYNIRYNVVNTLAALFGKEGIPLAHKILQSDVCKNVKEINSFYSCAIGNKKKPTKLGIDILKKVGCIKNVKPEVKDSVDNIFKNGIKKAIENSLDNQLQKPDIVLREHEYLADKIEFLLDSERGGFTNEKINILLSPPGTGKCLGYNTPVLMYDGSIKMVQDIKVGDQLMGIDSTPRNVLSTCTGEEEMFEIIPKKGDSWTCNKSHILSVIESGVWKYECGKNINPLNIEDLNITSILNLPKNHRKKLFRVPLDFQAKEVKIPPYILGLWLGDGSKKRFEIAVGSRDIEIQEIIINEYAKRICCEVTKTKDFRNEVYTLNITKQSNIKHNPNFENPALEALKNYDLINNKHIPKEYLLNSRKCRLMLFAGFIDADGGGNDCTYDIAIKTDRLKDDIVWLCRSLGYYVSISKKIVKHLNDKEINKEYWRVQISGDFSDLNKYIRLKRKCFQRIINKNPLVTGFKVKSIGIGKYYGFEIDGDKRFMLGDFTVTHNTFLLLKLAREGKRILLVEPFISVIQNKVESDEELMKIFQVFYDSNSLNNLDYGVNAISTFDKFAKCNYEKISRMFDYICIDESHLLFTSSYRIDTTSSAVRKLKELFYISSNAPTAAKLILMTGTETGDTYFFGDIANTIHVYKKSHTKEMEFLICDDTLDCITRLSYKTKELIEQGYRLLIPTNKGEIYSQKLIGMIEYLLGRPVKYGYYKRSNSEQEICKMINTYNTVGDYEIVFCSNYLSVGVDIMDNDKKFASIYFGLFSGYEIEQFNARIRKQGIKSIYCIQTEKNDGSTNDLLIEEPNLVLRINEEDIEHFNDDKQIAKAKQEFIAQYDPVLHKIVTPGFSYLNGAIRFNQEEYELVTFENKFLETMVHPVKVARELAKYGYNIKVCTEYNGLTEDIQEQLKKIGIESAREEKIRKHNLLVGTFIDLIENNQHISENGLEFNNVIEFMGKNKDLIVEDRELDSFVKIDWNIYGNPEKFFIKSREALDKMYASAKYIISKYSVQKAKEIIYKYVDDNGILKQKNFRRAINLLKLVDSADNNDLSEPMFITLEKLYDWMDKFQINKNYRISYNTYMADVDSWTNSYIDMLKIKITSTYGYQKIRDNIIEMLNNLGNKNTTKDGIRFEYNSLPDEDGGEVKYKRSVDTMVENMFRITTEAVTQNKRARKTHIVLESQPFDC